MTFAMVAEWNEPSRVTGHKIRIPRPGLTNSRLVHVTLKPCSSTLRFLADALVTAIDSRSAAAKPASASLLRVRIVCFPFCRIIDTWSIERSKRPRGRPGGCVAGVAVGDACLRRFVMEG